MGLKIAKKLAEGCRAASFPTSSDRVSTGGSPENKEFPTNRHIRQGGGAQNDDEQLITGDGLPVWFFNGDSSGCHYGDREWIAAKLRRVKGEANQQALAAEYSQRFKAAFDAEPVEHRKNGKARFIANNWLLKATK